MTRLPVHVQRRYVRLSLMVLSALASFALGWILLDSGQYEDYEQLVAWIGLFVSMAALLVSLAQFFPTLPPPTDAAQLADDLAVSVRAQWEEEVAARNLRTPRVIPLAWSATRRPVAAPPEETHRGAGDGLVLRPSLNGRLEGDFDAAARRLAEGYRRVPAGRLVVLGEPGSGKTVLAAILTLGLLAEREAGAPVPVLLTLAGWDPLGESLKDWIERTLGTAYYGGRTEIPRMLLRAQRLLLILDGLDEMPEASRRDAVSTINKSCGDGVGVVLTCRSTEFQDVIAGGAPVLRRAPVVEVAPVPTADMIAYLSDANWPDGVQWEPVYTHLRANPDGPMAAALSTPLALTLARTVYSNCDRDPGELLDFDSSHAVQDHLLDHIVTAAYAPDPGRDGGRDADVWEHDAKQAEKYLTYLAVYLQQHRERDLVWWLLSQRLSSPLAGLAVGTAAGLLATFTVVARMLFVGPRSDAPPAELAVGIGIGCAILTMIVWYAAPGASPGALSLRRGGSLARLGRGFTTGLKLAATPALPVGVAGAIALSFSGAWNEADLADIVMPTAAVCGGVLALCLALAVHSWLDAPPEHSKKASPADLLRQDRASSLTGALAAGAVFGVTVAPLSTIMWSTALILFSEATSTPIPPSIATFIADDLSNSVAYRSTWAFILATPLPGAVFSLLILLTRAWPRFSILRFSLAAQGKLPWNLLHFLSDARDRQLLRQSAGAYQFRHVRLQERLASRAPAQDRSTPDPRTGHRTIQAATGATAVTLLLTGALLMPGTSDRSPVEFIDTGTVASMTFGPRGSETLITVDEHGNIKHWDTETGDEVATPDHSIPKQHLTSSDDFGSAPIVIPDGVLGYTESVQDTGEDEFFEYRVYELFPWGNEEHPRRTKFFEGQLNHASAGLRYLLQSEIGGDYRLVRRLDTQTNVKVDCKNPTGTFEDWSMSGNGARAANEAGGRIYLMNFTDCSGTDDLWSGDKTVDSLALSHNGRELALNAGGVTWIRTLAH
ncbi:NACHT domain-containing protein [Streptomyces sp. NPDC091287]|uniref:NACHT domain-containing protein n=1 Tax=Streptomyces sp. NPDC091287 TaxID=3365988 RepID=UPI003815679C